MEKLRNDTGIVISQSALKHGYSEDDVQAVFDTYVFNNPLEGRDDIEIMLGFSTSGELLELFYEMKNRQIVVFHLMKCRKRYLRLLR
jgi:hypothetical protein